MLRMLTVPLMLIFGPLASAAPNVGEPAPSFRLQDQNNHWHTLENYKTRWLVLFFYPKADTPGCTKEACNLRDDISQFKALGVSVVGVSLDNVASQKAFAEKYHLPFPLLSDANKETAKQYGVLGKFLLIPVAKRQTFVIDPEGMIARHYAKVDPKTHSTELLADLKELLNR